MAISQMSRMNILVPMEAVLAALPGRLVGLWPRRRGQSALQAQALICVTCAQSLDHAATLTMGSPCTILAGLPFVLTTDRSQTHAGALSLSVK